jgi:similar to spore coat protein
MNNIVENLTGMNTLTDQVLTTDLLIAAKSGIKNYAVAITETATPEVRTVLRKQMDNTIQMHENIINHMMGQGWYHPYNVAEQIQLDMKNAQTALNITQ